MYQEDKRIMWFYFFILLTIVFFLIQLNIGCAQKSIVSYESEAPKINYVPMPKMINLSWEKDHPERSVWSSVLISEIHKNIFTLDKAKDIQRFYPEYRKLSLEKRLKVWGELFVAIAYFESSFNPNDSSVDVGKKEDKSTWSTGLFQVSSSDIKNYKLTLTPMSYDELKKPENNILLAVELMKYQIVKNGYIIQPSRKYLYWVTLYESILNRYDQTDAIISRVKKNAAAAL